MPYRFFRIKSLLQKSFYMVTSQYRIESRTPLAGRLLPAPSCGRLYGNRSLAVAVAVKSVADPTCQEVWVVHVPSGEVVFRTASMGHAS